MVPTAGAARLGQLALESLDATEAPYALRSVAQSPPHPNQVRRVPCDIVSATYTPWAVTNWRKHGADGTRSCALKGLAKESLREQASDVIRAEIIAGELEPGKIYSAITLAQRLDVSPTPVREALLDLANQGLVAAVRNRGYRVLRPDESDLDEIGELRLMLEVPAARLVAERATDEQLLDLEIAVGEMESMAHIQDPAAFLLADREFHLALLQLTGNQRLVRLVAQLRDQARLVGFTALALPGRQRAAAEHRGIFEALSQRDGARAETLMRAHIEHTRGIWAGRNESMTKRD